MGARVRARVRGALMAGGQSPPLERCSSCGTYHGAAVACPNGHGVRPGMVLDGKYELVRLLGRGGMGQVFEGRHRVIGRRVAVKFLHVEFAGHPEVVRRFENEAKAAGGLEHENIAGVYDVGSLPDGTQYLVMEYLDGEDIEHLVAREAPLSVARASFIMIQTCRALDAVHRRGIVHRDLKPANLFLVQRADRSDLVKVLDFGIAKLKQADTDGAATRTGTAIGTAHYMSPEQARGERDVDTRSDVYALGVILYELLSAKKPHEGESLLAILHRVTTQAPTPLEHARPGLPSGLYAVVRRALASDPSDRFATVGEFGDALLPFAGRPLSPIRSDSGRMPYGPSDGAHGPPPVDPAGDASAPPSRTTDGVARSGLGATLDESRATFALQPPRRVAPLVGGVVLAVVALLGMASVAMRSQGTPRGAAAAAQPTPVAPASETPTATPATTAPAITLAPVPSATPAPSASSKPPARPALEWHPTTPPPPSAPRVAVAPAAMAAPLPKAPTPTPPATNRGDNPF